VAKAGLDPALTFHGLRHVAASLMVELGEHPRGIQARLGHATSRLSMELYAHVPEAADRDVAAHFDASWSTARSGTLRARTPLGEAWRTGSDQGTSCSDRVEVMGLEPTTSTLRTLSLRPLGPALILEPAGQERFRSAPKGIAGRPEARNESR
jgi:hypothetical protein